MHHFAPPLRWFQVVSATDRLIMSEEGASSMGDCYAPTYHLSDTRTYFTYPNYSNAAHYTGMSTDSSDAQVLPVMRTAVCQREVMFLDD